MTFPRDDPPTIDKALLEVASALRELDPDGIRTAKVLRSTFDQLYDGQHTGRYHLDQLFKTEKTHFGTLVEINLQREFHLSDGLILDYLIAGHEVDCKYSHTGNWMLPIESFDHIVLVIEADDIRSKWSAGLVRVTVENRRTSENRDRKTGLNKFGRSQIHWLHKDAPMKPNALLQLSAEVVAQIMSGTSGQSRLNELFRRATNRRLSRTIIATVAQQNDYMKRVRDNGGSRSHLRPEGFLILGGDYHLQQNLATALGAVTPEPGEVVSVRVTRTDPTTGVQIGDSWWKLAQPDEPVEGPAPVLPR